MTPRRRSGLVQCFALAGALIFSAGADRADDIAAFYAGKTLKIIVGLPPGGGADAYARLVQRHLPGHLPGAPSIIVAERAGRRQPEIGGRISTRCRDDGTVLAHLQFRPA